MRLHLLRAWSWILAAEQDTWIPLQLTRICAGMADLSLPQLVQEIRADFTDSEVCVPCRYLAAWDTRAACRAGLG